MKDSTTPKFLFVMAVLAAVSFAIWAGATTTVEQPAQATTGGAYTTPF